MAAYPQQPMMGQPPMTGQLPMAQPVQQPQMQMMQVQVPQGMQSGHDNLASLLQACGLEGKLDMFQQEAYTLVDLKTALSSGQDVAIADLRLLKLPLGECRKILTELQAAQ